MDRLCRRERHMLERQKKTKKGRRSKDAAEQQHCVVRTDQAALGSPQTVNANSCRDDAAKEHSLHRGNMRDLLYANVSRKKSERR